MAEKGDWKDLVSLEELIMSNVYTQEALINLLRKKGLITNNELIEEIKNLKVKTQNSRQEAKN